MTNTENTTPQAEETDAAAPLGTLEADQTVEDAEVETGESQAAAATEEPVTEETPRSNETVPAPGNTASATSMIIGGVLAAAVGAAAALAILPEGWRPHDTSALDQRIGALETRGAGLDAADLAGALEPLESRISALEDAGFGTRLDALEGASAPDLAPLSDRIAALEAADGGLDVQAMTAVLAPLNTRMDQIEADIATQAQSAVASALAEARAEVEAQAAALNSRETDVAEAQAMIAARAALADLTAAAESGDAQAGALATLSDVAAVPDALAPFTEGLITLSRLQDDFAPAARAALAAAPPPPDAGVGDRLMTFLRSQTGARSLAPRDGNDADAVLSRAEATLRAGDLTATLNELDTLTGAPADAMADWRTSAQSRVDALAALDDLHTQLTRTED